MSETTKDPEGIMKVKTLLLFKGECIVPGYYCSPSVFIIWEESEKFK